MTVPNVTDLSEYNLSYMGILEITYVTFSRAPAFLYVKYAAVRT